MSRPLCAVVVGLALSAATVSAQYTSVSAASGGEKSHSQILASALGGTFNNSGSRDFSNGSIFADRLKDSSWSSPTDQIWAAGKYNAKIVAKEADYSHTFGYVAGSSGNTNNFQGLLDTDNVGSETSVTLDGSFRWAIKLDHSDGGRLFTSREKDNYNDRDHMVSYALYNAAGNIFGYALFFEDKKHNSDKDFNDVAVLLTLVPAPQAAAMGLMGLAGVGVLAGRRRTKI